MLVRNLLNEKALIALSESTGQRVQGAPEQVQKICKDCHRLEWFRVQDEPVCMYCQHDREIARKIQAWYDKGDYLKAPGRFLFRAGSEDKHNDSVVIEAIDTQAASLKARKMFGDAAWYGCNIVELNEYRKEGEEYSWGPKTNFLMNAVREYYQEIGEVGA